MNVGELNVTLKLDKAPYEKGLTQAEATGNKSRARLSKAVTVKVDTTDIKAMNAQVDALTKRGSQLRAALVNAIPRSSQARELNRQLREVETRIRNINKVSQEAKGSSLFGKLGGLARGASKLLGPLGLALGAGAVVGGIVNLGKSMIQMAMDAQESESLFEVSMGNMSAAARKWSEDTGKALGLNRYELRRTLGTFNVMLTSMGMFPDDAFTMSKGLTQLAQDMASFYNLDPTEAFEKLQSGLSGEIEPLKRLGIIVNDTMVKQYAMDRGIAESGRQMTEQQKILARYGLIMQATAKAQGDLARTADSPTNVQRRLTAQMDERKVGMGMKMIPAYKAIMMFLMKIAEVAEVVVGQIKILIGVMVELFKHFTQRQPATLFETLANASVVAVEAAKRRAQSMSIINATVADGAMNAARYARNAIDEEVEKVQELIEKRRDAAAERAKQLRQAMGLEQGGLAVWERGINASVRRAVSTTQDNRLTPGNLPTTREIVQMARDMARVQADTEVIRDHIREALSYA